MKAFFLDRDGVINVDNGYVFQKEEFIFKEGIFDALRWVQSGGFKIFVVTNQSGIGRGFFSETDFLELTHWMIKIFKENSIMVEGVEYCPHLPEDNCNCRKPKTKMIENIMQIYPIDIISSWLVGDKAIDIQMAEASGINNTILVNDYNNCELLKCNPKIVVNSLSDIIQKIKI